MKIHNLRIGHATNSSSSHSILLVPDAALVSEINYTQNSFQWDNFRLSTVEGKMRYIGAQLFNSLSGAERDRMIDLIEKDVPGYREEVEPFMETDGYNWDAPSVDHQSSAPQMFDDRMIRLLRSNRFVIMGGNDNSDGNPNVPEDAKPLMDMTEGRSVRMREDGDYIVIYNGSDGNKLRVSLNDNAPEYVKSSTPELVDLKITNWCDAGCNFCYQSSTQEGSHAPLDRIKATIDLLAEMETFEVAIGGGEPTSHPDFAEIITYAHQKGVTPNFTTLSDKWLSNEAIMSAVRHVGGIGVSCSSAKGLALAERIRTELRQKNIYGVTVMAQHVIGAQPLHVTSAFLDAAMEKYMPVLLLGYKTVGFGANYQRHDQDDADMFLQLSLKNYSERAHQTLSVDTALLDQYPNILKAINAPNALATSPEGKFSCYIDAVEDKMGMSSYVEPSQMTDMPGDLSAFKAVYATY